MKLNVEEPKDILQQSHRALFILGFSFLSYSKLARFSLFSSLFDSHCSPLYLLGFCYPRRKAEICEVWPVWPFVYLSLTNYTDFFCVKDFTANSSEKNIEEIKITNVGKWLKVTDIYKVLTVLFPWWQFLILFWRQELAISLWILSCDFISKSGTNPNVISPLTHLWSM